MKRRFVVFVDRATPEQQNVITQFFHNTKDVGFWHWFTDAWLVTDSTMKWTAPQLRNALKEIVPRLQLLVLQIDKVSSFAAFGDDQMFPWLRDVWSKD
jgi:hypothetical protein